MLNDLKRGEAFKLKRSIVIVQEKLASKNACCFLETYGKVLYEELEALRIVHITKREKENFFYLKKIQRKESLPTII